MEGGHYIIYCKRDGETWLRFDDDKVTVTREDVILAQDPYLLFYHRRAALQELEDDDDGDDDREEEDEPIAPNNESRTKLPPLAAVAMAGNGTAPPLSRANGPWVLDDLGSENSASREGGRPDYVFALDLMLMLDELV